MNQLTAEQIKTLKDSFIGYEHPFDWVISIIKLIRSLKSDFKLGTRKVKSATIVVKNEHQLAALIQSVDDIKNLCKIGTLFINYCDDKNINNNLCLQF